MNRPSKKHTFGLVVASLTAVLQTSNLTWAAKPWVIYGEDNRIEYYELKDESSRQHARATAALINGDSLIEKDKDTYQILSAPYGQKLGLCSDEPFYSEPEAAFCSGFLLAPDIIVTAGHCIANELRCKNTRFVFGYYMERPGEAPSTAIKSNVFSCKKLLHTVSNPSGADFALIQLDRQATQVKPLPYRQTGQIEIGDSVEVMGYPAGLPLKIAGGATVRSVAEPYFVTNLDTYGGNSGSAVFNSNGGWVEGIIVRGELDWDSRKNCRISRRCLTNACRGEDVTKIEAVIPYLQTTLKDSYETVQSDNENE